ncbi:hypothetical protein E4631_24175 [Hymenobacter sp. UV11]|nr:hypothetical protein E4631_24175 [Hymenobacter sp. UV11]
MEAAKPAGKRQRTKYDAAFRTEAVRRVSQDGQAATRVAQALGMSEAVLGKWVRAACTQAARPAGSEALEQENKQLRAQLARAEMERDMLKKALTIAQMLDAHFHKRRADETLCFHCLACSLLARACAVPLAGCQPQRLLRVAEARAGYSRASACRLASSRPARVHHPCRPLWSAPATGPTAARRLCGGSPAAARLVQR